MKPTDYKAILAAVEKALVICDESAGFMDAIHRKICHDLRDARTQLLRLIETQPKSDAT